MGSVLKICVFGFVEEDILKFPAIIEPISISFAQWPEDEPVLVRLDAARDLVRVIMSRGETEARDKNLGNAILYIPKYRSFFSGILDRVFSVQIYEGEWDKLISLLNTIWPVCGYRNSGIAEFCIECGWKLDKKIKGNYCIDCGKGIIQDSCYPYCPGCLGKEMSGKERTIRCFFCGEKLGRANQKEKIKRHCPFCGARIDDIVDLVCLAF